MEFDALLDPLRGAWIRFGAFLPSLTFAIVVVIAGWLVAKMARFAVVKALRAINLNVLSERAGLDEFLRQGGIRSDTTEIFGVLVYWLVILAALVAAFNAMGMNYVTELLRQALLLVPRLMLALLVLTLGAYFARFVAGAVMAHCQHIGVQDAELLGRLAQYATLAFVFLIALEQMQIGGDIVRYSFLILLGGAVFALALAFGLGGQAWAAEMLDRWWPRGRRDDRPRMEDVTRRQSNNRPDF